MRPAHTHMADLLETACTEPPGSRSRHVVSPLEEARTEPPGSRSRHVASPLEEARTKPPGSRSRHVANLLEEARTEPPGSGSRHQQYPCPEFTCVATWYQGWNCNSTESRSHCATRAEESVRTPAGNMPAARGTIVAQTYTQLAAAAAHMHTRHNWQQQWRSAGIGVVRP